MAIALGGTDKDRLTKIFTDLAEGGTIKMPLAEQPPGYRCWLAHGQIRDQLDGEYRHGVAPERQLLVARGANGRAARSSRSGRH